ncbi:transmembrane protein, putative [Medicago truncatula]|uniref:Transmembrane protein, putative n=1 Tax=Medicago truncatula TaxID=3880 RepID=G7L353_MEDTR|nr:transmembrane protein, putative [Medicago truncatula]
MAALPFPLVGADAHLFPSGSGRTIYNFVILLLPLIFPMAASSITDAAAPFRHHRSMSLSHSKSQCYKSSPIDSPLNDSFEEINYKFTTFLMFFRV